MRQKHNFLGRWESNVKKSKKILKMKSSTSLAQIPEGICFCDPCDPLLGSIEDISPAQIYRAGLTSVVFFLPPFLCCYLFSRWNIHLFVLVFSDPILFSISFPVFYFPCLLLSIFLHCFSLHILYFLFLSSFVCLLLSFLLPSIFILLISLFII